MFKPKTEKINEISKKYTKRIERLEELLENNSPYA